MARRGSWNTLSEGIYKGVAAVWQAKKDEFASRVKPSIKRNKIMPLGITGYTTIEQKMPKFSRKSLTKAIASGILPLNNRRYTALCSSKYRNRTAFFKVRFARHWYFPKVYLLTLAWF